jgi:hypothetical protein
MSLHNRLSVPPSEQAAVEDSGGCLTVLLMPVMALGLVSIIMMCVFGGLTVPPTPSSNALAAPAAAANLVAPSPESVVQDIGGLSNVFTIEVQHWNVSILRWASETGLDPNLIATVMQIESCGDPRAVSRVGAMGLFQVMPYHFYGDDDPYNPDTNAARGLAYLLKSITKSGGDVRLALAGYNGGVGVIGRSENAWAAETQRYAYWGSGIYNDAIQGTTESERLLEWLAAGGASLCQQAHQRLGLP